MRYLRAEWKEREISIGEFEDLWEENNRPEVAKAYLELLREAENISSEEKIKFFSGIIGNTHDRHLNFSLGYGQDKNQELVAVAVRYFLELVPHWNERFEKECRSLIFVLPVIPVEYLKGCEGKLKVFIHSVLNGQSDWKEDLYEKRLSEVLIHLKMFEELVNYNFTLRETIEELGSIISPRHLNPFFSWSKMKPGQMDKIIEPLKENRAPHAMSALLRLLAKRGDLEEII